MNKNILNFAGFITGLLIAACSPDSHVYHDNDIVDISTIDSVALVPNHVMVLADGNAQLDLRPLLFTKEKNQIPDNRVNEAWLEYNSYSGVKLTRYFSTADASLIGQTLTATVKIKGTGIESQPISFRVVAPLDKEYMREIRIPVVFHIIQTTKDIEDFGGNYTQEQVTLLLSKLNNVFSGVVSVNPVGVNTHICLEPALYDQNGRRMPEPGINRLTLQEIDITNSYSIMLENHHLVWPADKYMNIWLISDREKKNADFANTISEKCTPHYVYAGTPELSRPKGISWSEAVADLEFKVNESGIIYKLQELDEMGRPFQENNKPANNDLIYYVGRYLGLLPTCSYSSVVATDYCEDTHDYFPDLTAPGSNKTWYKQANGCYFRSENIMDDACGVHSSISKNQYKRIRWVLENCPERAAWKSDFAFTGK